MVPPDFNHYPLWINFALFAAAAIAVWLAGTRLSRYADAIARHTGAGHVVVGLVLLASVTSLPEIAIAIFSASAGNPELTVNNLLGGLAVQKVILAGTDALIGKDAITIVVSSPSLMMQGVLGIMMLAVVSIGIVVPDTPLFGIGLWSWLILALYVYSIWLLSINEKRQPWRPAYGVRADLPDAQPQDRGSLPNVSAKSALAALVILAAGFLLSQTGDAIARQTGLGQSFVGAVLLGFATSLPELSTVASAMRLRLYEMAIAEILGGNLFNVALIFLVDAVYPGPPVLDEVGNFSLFVSLLSIVLTTVFLIGLIERHNRTIARMGIDSLATLAIYGAGLFFLYQIR